MAYQLESWYVWLFPLVTLNCSVTRLMSAKLTRKSVVMYRCAQANSNWLYIVPTGMYGCVNYIREKYKNPTIIISENGT